MAFEEEETFILSQYKKKHKNNLHTVETITKAKNIAADVMAT